MSVNSVRSFGFIEICIVNVGLLLTVFYTHTHDQFCSWNGVGKHVIYTMI
jgi:hypothetical protein